MFKITERARNGSERICFDTANRETAARMFCALTHRKTFTVLRNTAPGILPEFVERPAVAVVMHAIDARNNRPASFTADAGNGRRYTVSHYVKRASDPAPSPPTLPGYPVGAFDLSRLTKAPHDKTRAISEPGRRYG